MKIIDGKVQLNLDTDGRANYLFDNLPNEDLQQTIESIWADSDADDFDETEAVAAEEAENDRALDADKERTAVEAVAVEGAFAKVMAENPQYNVADWVLVASYIESAFYSPGVIEGFDSNQPLRTNLLAEYEDQAREDVAHYLDTLPNAPVLTHLQAQMIAGEVYRNAFCGDLDDNVQPLCELLENEGLDYENPLFPPLVEGLLNPVPLPPPYRLLRDDNDGGPGGAGTN